MITRIAVNLLAIAIVIACSWLGTLWMAEGHPFSMLKHCPDPGNWSIVASSDEPYVRKQWSNNRWTFLDCAPQMGGQP